MMANPILDKISKLNAEIEQLRAENSHLRRVGMDRPSAELHEAAMAELRAENERLRSEVEEQARLLGMGSEREARLRARVEVLSAAIVLMASLAPKMTIDTSDPQGVARDFVEIARATLEAKP